MKEVFFEKILGYHRSKFIEKLFALKQKHKDDANNLIQGLV